MLIKKFSVQFEFVRLNPAALTPLEAALRNSQNESVRLKPFEDV